MKKILYYGRMFLGYYFAPPGKAFLPTQVGFLPTARCNLRCGMCAQWGKSGNFNLSGPDRLAKDELPVEVWERVVDELSSSARPFGGKPKIVVWGGEPLLYKGISGLLEKIKAKGLGCLLITNGTLLDKFAESVVACGVDEVEVSLDGPEEVHDAIRGKGSYAQTIKGIEALKKAKDAGNASRPDIIVNTVVNENTYTRLTEVAGIARRKGADAVNFIQGWAVPERIGRAHEKACMDSLGIAAPSWKGFEREGPGMDIAELAAAMREIREYQKEVGLLKFYFLPDIGPDELEAFYSGMNVAGHERCYSLWTRADIRFNGDVVFCGDYPDYAAGNIRDGAFLRIWNGEKAAKFRQSVKKNKVLPVCCMCCNLYQYNWPRA